MLKLQPQPITWQLFVDRVVSWGHDEHHVKLGSMPSQTLSRLAPLLSGNGLQIGGFVGVSHCCIAVALKKIGGTICTIDLNVKHRGIHQPLSVAYRLVTEFKLLNNSMLISGYALHQMQIFIAQGVKFDFIILDGNHDYEAVMAEIDLSDKLLKSGGLLILDDIDHWDGPKKIYHNFHLDGYEKVPLDSRAGVLRKSDFTTGTTSGMIDGG